MNAQEHDKTYGRVLGMSNNGYSVEQIATCLHVSRLYVIDTMQKAYARSAMFKRK